MTDDNDEQYGSNSLQEYLFRHQMEGLWHVVRLSVTGAPILKKSIDKPTQEVKTTIAAEEPITLYLN